MKKSILLFSLCEGQSWMWGREGTSFYDGYGISADNKGNSYLAGEFSDTMSFGNYHLHTKYWNAFLVKYDSNGNVKWATQTNSASSLSYCLGILSAPDKGGNVYVVGDVGDTVLFGNDTIKQPLNSYNAFLAKYDSNGNFIWVRKSNGIGSIGASSGEGIATDDSGNVYIAGNFFGVTPFGSDTLKTIDTVAGDIFIVKYDKNGNQLWVAKSTNAKDADITLNSLTVDDSGKVYITGYFNNQISFGSLNLNDATQEVFLVKYDRNGNPIWAKQSGGYDMMSSAESYGITTDEAGSVYITGLFENSIYFDSTLLHCGYNSNIFLVKYDKNGQLIWAKQSQSSIGNVYYGGYSLSSDKYCHIYFSGGGPYKQAYNVIFCGVTFSGYSTSDISIVMQLDTSGKALCSSIIGTGGDDNNTIACSESGRYVYLGGDIYDTITFGEDFLTVPVNSENPFVARWQPCVISRDAGVNSYKKSENYFSLFPNPSTGTFTLQTVGTQNFASATIEIYNVLGERVKSEELSAKSEEIDLTNQPSGIYFYRVLNENGSVLGSGKVIIEK